MSWSLSKPNVSLAVTKFAPETDKPVAGLAPMDRARLRDRREKECAKVEPAMEGWIYEVRRAHNAFLYGSFVEIVDTTIHPGDCTCVICVPEPPKIRQPYDELYLKQKADPWR